jgi:hypothetical protein
MREDTIWEEEGKRFVPTASRQEVVVRADGGGDLGGQARIGRISFGIRADGSRGGDVPGARGSGRSGIARSRWASWTAPH